MKKFSIVVIGMFLAVALSSSLSTADEMEVLSDLRISLIYVTHGPNNQVHQCWTYTFNAGPGTAQNPDGFYTGVYLNHDDHPPYASTYVASGKYTAIRALWTKIFAPLFFEDHIPDEMHSCTGFADDGDRVEETNENNNWRESAPFPC